MHFLCGFFQHLCCPVIKPTDIQQLLSAKVGVDAMLTAVLNFAAALHPVAHRFGVFARSVFPLSSLGGDLAHLRKLRDQPLGAILFKHPGMHRCPFELARMAGDSDYLPVALHQATAAWGRRSRFEIEGKGLMVSEIFLQPFSPWPVALPVHRTQRGKVGAAIVASTQ